MDRFEFRGFVPSDAVRIKAGRMYDRVCDSSPADAVVSALLDWDGERYHCSIEVGSREWPVAVGVAHRFPGIAIDKAELALNRKLARWQGFRFTPLQGEARGIAEASA